MYFDKPQFTTKRLLGLGTNNSILFNSILFSFFWVYIIISFSIFSNWFYSFYYCFSFIQSRSYFEKHFHYMVLKLSLNPTLIWRFFFRGWSGWFVQFFSMNCPLFSVFFLTQGTLTSPNSPLNVFSVLVPKHLMVCCVTTLLTLTTSLLRVLFLVLNRPLRLLEAVRGC